MSFLNEQEPLDHHFRQNNKLCTKIPLPNIKGQSLNELHDPNQLGKYVATKNEQRESIDFKMLVN